MASVTTTARHRPMVRLPLIARNQAMARVTTTARHRPTVRLPLIAHRPATVRASTMARHRPTVGHAAMTRQTTMGRHLVTVRHHARRTQFRMLFRPYAPHAICSGDAPKVLPVPGPADGGGCAILVAPKRSMRDLTAAMVRHPVHAIMAYRSFGPIPAENLHSGTLTRPRFCTRKSELSAGARGIRTPDPIISKRGIGASPGCTIIRSGARK